MAELPYNAPLKIGIDGRKFQGNVRGDGKYVFNLCLELDKLFPKATFFIYSSRPVNIPVLSDRWILRDDSFPFTKLPPLLWLKFRGGYFCRKDHLDVFWGASMFFPSLPKKVRKVLTIYDIAFEVVPDTLLLRDLWANKVFFYRDVQKADYLLSISTGTANRIYKRLGLTSSVVYPAVGEKFRAQTKEQIESCQLKHELFFPYILSVAAWEPRKNLETLIETFIEMKKEGLLPHHKLVLVGTKSWKFSRLESLVGDDENNNIVYLGYVAENYLPPLYAGADMFVFPSLYEGYGMPALEARACGVRIVTTDIPELHEAAGEAAIFIQPDKAGIRNGILTAFKQQDGAAIRNDLPSWESSAKILANALIGSTKKA